ncbi:phospholipase A2 [Sciscionella sediminilitoris]|uniref:phospholipase A2 n=1 Tax=Sciscionella sediminilitoris TaxID=1445613 RepID=UPI0004DF6FD2|nr:phospholipase A2 [Sciscionella sp. SE31]
MSYRYTRRTGRAAAVLLTAAAITFGVEAAAQATPAQPNPHTAVAKKDYCGGSGISKWVPDHWFKADFSTACFNHDNCYSHNSNTDRKTCDINLRTALRDSCLRAYPSGVKGKTCFAVTSTYYGAVRKFAKSHYHGSGNPA